MARLPSTWVACLMSTCRRCNAEIFWALTKNDELMPVDYEPCADGNLEVELNELDGSNRVSVVDPKQQSLFGKPRYMPHWATCPHAKEFRKR